MVSPSPAQLQPRIHRVASIRNDPALERRIRDFVNEGYRYIAPKDASRWNPDDDDRLSTADSIAQELGEYGFFAVIYDPKNDSKPIACAATTPWKCDLEGGGQGDRGWEIKLVTSAAEWMRGGLAGRCINAVVAELLTQGHAGGTGRDEVECGQKLMVWVQTVECVNGEYWKKKGWKELRGYGMPVGHWGSKEGYRLLVMLQEFDFGS